MPFENPLDSLTLPEDAISGPRLLLGATGDLPQLLRNEYGEDIVGIIYTIADSPEWYSFDVSGGGGRYQGSVYDGAIYQSIRYNQTYMELGSAGNGQGLIRVSADDGDSNASKLSIHTLLGGDKRVCASVEGLIAARAVADSTASAAFVNKTVPTFNFAKQYKATRLKVDWAFSCYASAAAVQAEFALRLGGVDYTLGGFYFNLASTHLQVTGSTFIAEGVVSGLYSPCQVRWRNAGAAGTLFTDANDWNSCIVTEVDEGP